MGKPGQTLGWLDARKPFRVLPPVRVKEPPLFIGKRRLFPSQPPLIFYPELPAPISDIWGSPGVSGGIPTYSAGVVVTDYGAVPDGVTDCTAAFTSAYNAAANGTAIIVPAGTYKLTGSVTIRKNVVFRGAGSASKIIFARTTSGEGFRFLHASGNSDANYVNLTGGYDAGSYVVTLASTTAFSVGDYVEIKQTNDPTLITDPQSYSDNAQGQISKVTAKTSTTLTLADPLLLNYSSTYTPQVRKLNVIENAGLEDLYIESANSNMSYMVYFSGCVNCWVKNVEMYKTYERHITTYSSYRMEIRDNRIHGSWNFTGGKGYGVALDVHTSRSLVQNNLFYDLRHAMQVKVGAIGNVFGYNRSFNSHNENAAPNNKQADISLHGHYPSYNLFEGNSCEWIGDADYYGPSGHGNTLFRNQVNINSTALSLYADTIFIYDNSHNQNVIGNTLLYGGIEIASSVKGTVVYGNRLIEGADTPTQATLDTLPDSLYLTSKPSWYGSMDFPSIGADFAAGTIPAGNITFVATVADADAQGQSVNAVLGSIAFSTSPAEADTTAESSSAVLGSVTFTAAPAEADAAAEDSPAVLGSIAFTTSPAEAITEALDSDGVLGAITFTAAPAEASTEALASDGILGSVTFTAEPADANVEAEASSAVLGSVTLSTTPAEASTEAQATDAVLGSVTLSTQPAQANVEAEPAAAVLGSVVFTTTPADANVEALEVVTEAGSITFSTTPAGATTEAQPTDAILGSVTFSTTAAEADAAAQDSNAVLGSVDFATNPAEASIEALPVTLPGTTVTTTPAEAAAGALPVTAILGSVVFATTPAGAAAEAMPASAGLSSIVFTAAPAEADIEAKAVNINIGTATEKGGLVVTIRKAGGLALSIRK